MAEEMDRETKAYLARIRKTVEESNRLVEQVGLRIRETEPRRATSAARARR